MRDDGITPDLYFGRPGSLVTLPWPLGGPAIEQPYDRQVADFVAGAGTHRVSKLAGGSRTFTLNWRALGLDTYSRISAYDSGHNGIGPWAFINPSFINLLTANQSAATGITNSTDGFTTPAANHGSVFSNADATHIHRSGAQRSLRWQWPTAPTASPRMELSSVYSEWHGVPVVVGKSYVFSVWAKPDGVVDASIQVEAKIQWRNATGATVGSESSGGVVTVTAWTRLTCVASAPVGAVYASFRLVAVSGTITTGASLYLDEFQVEMATAVTDWVPGTGTLPVETLGFTDKVPFAAAFREGPTLVLREVS